MLTAPATHNAPSAQDNGVAPQHQLPTPPLAHATLPPLKLRLRSRKADAKSDGVARKRITKRAPAPPRGANKRRRDVDDDMGRDDADVDSDVDITDADNEARAAPRMCTPKRARLAPEILPLGLERSDFYNLQNGREESDPEAEASDADVDVEADGEEWSLEDDRILVELILEKLKLSKTDWQDCARSLGKDRSSVGRRWKSLMVNGEVGLKTGSRRGKLHGSWR